MQDKNKEKHNVIFEAPIDTGLPSTLHSKNPPTKENSKDNCPPAPVCPQMSTGEDVYNKTVYTGLNYWVNLISSVAIADYFVNLKGRDKLDVLINKTTQALTKMGVGLKSAHSNSKTVLETLVLTSGGLILLAPLKWMEDRKRPIVHWLNEKLGVDQTAPDGHKETPDEIHIEEEVPKKSWGNVIWRRILGTAGVAVAGSALDILARDKKQVLPPETYDLGWDKITYESKIKGGKANVTDRVFNFLNKGSEYIIGHKADEHGAVSRWTKLAILDVAFTIITAVTMKITNGAVKAKMPHEIDESSDKPSHDKIPDHISPDEQTVKTNFADKVGRKEMPVKHSDSFVEAASLKSSTPAQLGA